MGLSLKVSNLSLSIGNKTLLRNVSFDLEGPGLFTILGENGAGKSTFLKALLDPDRKSETFLFQPKSPRIGYLSHELGLYSSLSAKENIEYFSSLQGNSLPESEIKELFQVFKIKEKAKDPIYTLSRGQKQKVALMRTLSMDPNLILLDEPFTGLDFASKDILIEILNAWSNKALILIVLHEKVDSLHIKGRLEFLDSRISYA